jgi:hypothetical protein
MEQFPVASPQVDLNDRLPLDAHIGEPADLQVERPESTAAGPVKTSAAALSMITKEKSPMRAFFFRDHEISGLRPAALAGESSRRAGQRPQHFKPCKSP